MSAFTKVLIVFVLLLSVVFAGAQVFLFKNREHYGKLAIERYEALQTAQQTLEETQADLTEARESLDARQVVLDKLEAEYAEAKASYAERDRKNEALVAGYKDTVDKLTADMTALQTTIKDERARADGLRDRNIELEQTINQKRDQIAALDKEIAELTSENNMLDAEIAEVKTQRTQLDRAKKALEDEIEEIVARTGITRPGIQVPDIDAIVVQVSDDNRMVVINKGTRDGVAPGHKFTVWNDEGVLGFFFVNTVQENAAAGPLTTYEGAEVNKGAMATTKIQ